LSDSIRQQQNLIHRYISMSRTSEGTPDEISLDKIIGDVTNINSYKASNKRITFKRNLEGTRRAVNAVEMDLYLILWNLINNAVKFSRGNKPSTITITERYTSDSVVVSIRDEGVGIKEEDKPHIWDLGFSTIAPDEKRETSGIGLAAVKELVRVIDGGNINVKSRVNAGAEFILTIAQPD
jgi:signal transduction histidine kinase